MKKMTKSLSILALVLGLWGCGTSVNQERSNLQSPENGEDSKPNIIVIVADDAGYVDFGFMGSQDLETPNLDSLAQMGTVFSDAHVTASVCAPSRAGLMMGRYQQKTGFEANGNGPGLGIDPSELTIASALKTQGYKTAAIGKWHLGSRDAYHPNNRGFDEFYGFLTGSRSYWPMDNPSVDKMLQHNGKRVVFDGYMTDVLGDYSVEFVKQHADSPFFMYLAYNAVHTPMHAKEEHLQKYKGHPRKELAAMTWSMDENIGRLVNTLEQEGILDNTIVFFLSDNGGAYSNQSSMGPLKGNKGNKFEGGHRVPFVMTWTGLKDKVSHFDGLTSSLDIFATAMDAAGVDETVKPNLDGVSLLPFVTGKKVASPHESLFWRKLKMAAARVGDKKLIRLDGYGYRMYDLNKDIGEIADIQHVDEAGFTLVNQALENWEAQLIQPKWREPAWEDVTFHIHQALMENTSPKYRSPAAKRRFERLNNRNNN